MNDTVQPGTSAAARLRARVARLASDPRLKFLPEGGSIVRELGDVLAQVDDLDRRLAATERGFAQLVAWAELYVQPTSPCD